MRRVCYCLLAALCLLGWAGLAGCVAPAPAVPPTARADLTATVEAERLALILTALARPAGPAPTQVSSRGR